MTHDDTELLSELNNLKQEEPAPKWEDEQQTTKKEDISANVGQLKV